MLAVLVSAGTASAVELEVVAVTPTPNTMAPNNSTVSIEFDRAVLLASIDSASFRVFGRYTGAARGSFGFSNSDKTVTFTPNNSFSAGELITVNLSHDVLAADADSLRGAGYFFQFLISTAQTSFSFLKIDEMSNRIDGVQTRIYGVAVSDLDEDGFLDLTTVNEVSADIRVFLNKADGTGLYHEFLSPQAVGGQASPNETADFDNDGHADLCLVAFFSADLWVMLGAGDGTYSTVTSYATGNSPSGVTTLDIDGDGDWDIVNSNLGDNNMSIWINDGSGVFTGPQDIDGGANGEDGLAAADMNGDGIGDVVAAGRFGENIAVSLGNGDGTFTLAGPAQPSGGDTWVIAVGDLNNDGDLDVACANSFRHCGSVLMGRGDGTFGPPDTLLSGSRPVSTDLGDLDGDGDLDMVLSMFQAGYWRLYANDGYGRFIAPLDFDAPANPSCAVLYDFDNDQDLDMVLTDEIADVVLLMENQGLIVDVPMVTTIPGIQLLPNRPNPFSQSTNIRFRLEDAGSFSLQVYDLSGRLVATRETESVSAGWQEIEFNGIGNNGARLNPGSYYYRIRSGAALANGKMMITQ